MENALLLWCQNQYQPRELIKETYMGIEVDESSQTKIQKVYVWSTMVGADKEFSDFKFLSWLEKGPFHENLVARIVIQWNPGYSNLHLFE